MTQSRCIRDVIHIKDASLPKDVSLSRLYMVTRRIPVFRKRIKFLADPFFEISIWISTQVLMSLSSTTTSSIMILLTGYLVLDFFTQLCTCRNRTSWKISTCNYHQSIRLDWTKNKRTCLYLPRTNRFRDISLFLIFTHFSQLIPFSSLFRQQILDRCGMSFPTWPNNSDHAKINNGWWKSVFSMISRIQVLGLRGRPVTAGDGAGKLVSWTWSISPSHGWCRCGNMNSNEDSATTPLFARKREKNFR